ncbi:MAG: hypothetical protein A3A61_00115 [Candidatus Woykebacteria bacterium RIFCSPLOWO2_01_FULL_43_14]|uniref:Antitoxin n=2 Tax=Candidatus Woykeibacteriota TaxID=1817899 RepID=A0A1G1WUG6_9BACT|nr:MAG: hypothetical protein A3J50_00340 [Candidatus Woykebacteria bacterium RIFCSPHIGHO2_02_FULL_43_16b]OGY30817.1 MAG: hypothetical protein A3A61_00115 [Candidatus Woykebacteria bacterium RIFCSPLOWO2_01_FULL_43_14]
MKSYISQDPEILGGKPVITGTRMSVESILELISSGMTINEILKEYSFITRNQVQSALEYATKIVGKEESYIFKKSKVAAHEISGRR